MVVFAIDISRRMMKLRGNAYALNGQGCAFVASADAVREFYNSELKALMHSKPRMAESSRLGRASASTRSLDHPA
jgi:hypothetical protein